MREWPSETTMLRHFHSSKPRRWRPAGGRRTSGKKLLARLKRRQERPMVASCRHTHMTRIPHGDGGLPQTLLLIENRGEPHTRHADTVKEGT